MQAITTKFYGPTNTRGSRVKASAQAGNLWHSWELEFKVQNATGGGFRVVAYQGAGVNFPIESKTTQDREEAQRWADRENAGEQVPEAGFASYSDD